MGDNLGFDQQGEEISIECKKNGEVTKDVDEAITTTQSPESSLPEALQEDGVVQKVEKQSQLLYTIDDSPPWYMCILLGMQHYLTMVGSTITIPFVLTPLMCIDENDPVRGTIVSTILFVSGMVTLLQATFGVRLPIVQGGTFSFLVPTIAILTTAFPSCEEVKARNLTDVELQEEWQIRMRSIQGAIAVSAIFQVVIGFTGLIGLLLTWITPLAIAPTVALVGLSLFDVAAQKASLHWGIAFMTIALMILFSQYLRDIPVPIPTYKKGVGLSITRVYVFKLFPVVLAMTLSWLFCFILTASNAIDKKSFARTDRTTQLLADSPWIRVPYPGQWGLPSVSVAGVFGMLAGVIASMIESVGDYYACARLAGAKPPPVHAVNRGVFIEGLGCILAGLWGTGNGTTSYSENIGAIGVTKVGSRRVIQYGALIMMIFGIFGKFGALFVTIPEPVVGGVFCVMFAMITAVGLSSLQYVDLNSSRNLFVLGFSLFFGLALPKWMESKSHAGVKVIDTGDEIADQIITVLLQTSMFVGGALGFFLDNTIPGTDEERGLLKWNAHLSNKKDDDHSEENAAAGVSDTYDFPLGMRFIKDAKWTQYFPASPTFTGYHRYRRFLPSVSGLRHRFRPNGNGNERGNKEGNHREQNSV